VTLKRATSVPVTDQGTELSLSEVSSCNSDPCRLNTSCWSSIEYSTRSQSLFTRFWPSYPIDIIRFHVLSRHLRFCSLEQPTTACRLRPFQSNVI